MLKKSLAVLLAITFMISIFTITPISADAGTIDSGNAVSDDLTVTGTSSFGNMISSEIDEKQEEQEENDGNNIFSVEMNGNVATVDLQTSQDAALIVAVYSEDEKQMLASGQSDVTAETENAEVTIEIDTMPQYFYIKAYLVDKECYRPLGTVYENPIYTREMQEFLSKTTADFEQEKVLNLDEDTQNNFAVFNNNVEIINQTAGVNEIVSADNDSKTYVIENADESITSLQPGEIFTYAYDETVLIIKIKSISVNGTTATIQGDEMELEEAFDYVKLDGTSQITEENYDDSTTDDYVNFEGITSETEYGEEPAGSSKSGETVGADEGEWSIKNTAKYTFDEKKSEEEYSHGKLSGKISGSVTITINTKLKYYVSLTHFYFEFSVKTSVDLKVAFSIDGEFNIKLGHFGFIPVTGVWVSFTPSIVFEGTIELDFTGTLETTLGFRVSEKGLENISTKPVLKGEIKLELKVFIGLSLKPKIEIFGILVKASAEAKLGAEATMSIKTPGQPDDGLPKDNTKKHECTLCAEGDVYAKFALSFEVQILNIEKWKFKKSFELKFKISDMHYSFDYCEFGFSKCPHYKYLTAVKVTDAIGQPVSGATVCGDYRTNDQGITGFYLSNGEHNIDVQSPKGNKTETVKIDGAPKVVSVELDYYGAAGKIAQIDASSSAVMALTTDGDIYIWAIPDKDVLMCVVCRIGWVVLCYPSFFSCYATSSLFGDARLPM